MRCLQHLLEEKSPLQATHLLAATCVPSPSVHHFIPVLSPAAAELSFLQVPCPAGFAGGFSFQLNSGGKMMLSIPFACRLSHSPTGR